MNEKSVSFESLRHHTTEGLEYWSARELAPMLEYREWRNFENVIGKAKQACLGSKHPIADHFVETTKMVVLGSGSQRELSEVHLSRYACYLIVQNGDPTKAVIAAGQTYFAIQTRRQELEDDQAFQNLKDDQKRLLLRNELREHNKQLVEAAQQAGVETGLEFAVFQNHGYKGLYGGLDQKAIHQRKQLKKSQKILDHMGSTELAANLFRATQTEEKLRRDNVQGKHLANLVRCTLRWVKKSAIPLLSWEGLCRRNFLTQQRASNKSNWLPRSFRQSRMKCNISKMLHVEHHGEVAATLSNRYPYP